MNLKVLILGDIVGKPGRIAVKEILSKLTQKENINFCIANAENTAGGSGVTPPLAEELFSYGINVITSGDHIWKQKEIVDYIEKTPYLLRPANYPPKSSGHGYVIYSLPNEHSIKIAVINLQGRVFMPTSDCPFRKVDDILTEVLMHTKTVFVDMHAEATSEKVAMGWYLDGRVSCIFGTHTHIQTADETILPKGTAYITDVGMSGPYDSVIGRRTDRVLNTFISGMPSSFDVAKNDVRLSGIIVSVDTLSGKATAIKRIVERLSLSIDSADETK
jgi:metallophosphoesterase (TIGR00282 family)